MENENIYPQSTFTCMPIDILFKLATNLKKIQMSMIDKDNGISLVNKK